MTEFVVLQLILPAAMLAAVAVRPARTWVDRHCGAGPRTSCSRIFASERVRTGQRVSAEMLGEAGNSGNSSTPHLHIHAQEPGPASAPFSGKPLPMTFGGRYLVRGDRIEARK